MDGQWRELYCMYVNDLLKQVNKVDQHKFQVIRIWISGNLCEEFEHCDLSLTSQYGGSHKTELNKTNKLYTEVKTRSITYQPQVLDAMMESEESKERSDISIDQASFRHDDLRK